MDGDSLGVLGDSSTHGDRAVNGRWRPPLCSDRRPRLRLRGRNLSIFGIGVERHQGRVNGRLVATMEWSLEGFKIAPEITLISSILTVNGEPNLILQSYPINVYNPTPTALHPPPITESTLLQAVESSQRHFIEHLSPHLTPSILPSVQASFDLTTRCLAFCTLFRLSYPQPSVHRLLHPLILTGATNPESILNELACAQERLNVNTTRVFEALITAYCELEKPDEALKSFYFMKEKGFLPNIETCNDMLMLFLEFNRNQAQEFIRHLETIGVKPAIYNYNTLIHNGEKYEAACVMFQDMTDDGLVLGSYSINSFIFVMYKEGRLEEASEILPEMLESKSGLVPHALIYDSWIDECCGEGIEGSLDDIDKAIAYKDEMISRGIQPTIVTYTLLIEALFEVGRSWGAEDMIKEMHEKGLKSDVYTYNTLMSGYAKRKYMDRHISLYDEMVEKRIQPNLLTYNTMMLAYCRCWKVNEAQKLFDEMKTKGIKPDYISYNLLIGGYCDRGGDVKEAFRVRDEMLMVGFDPTITTYKALVLGCCTHHEVEHAEEVLKEMVNKGICTPDDREYLVLTEMIKETADEVVGNRKR
ncbi:pentatricopeptide repeat-containing protein At2g15630, mitochondrial-like [Lotus japonicus]|uniref:pentatricopeptide repeat-containing protein At2g15630, mitochondrial-like n=1 Tax=Lotus japonicus TaxID=34305 RepID=UPI002590B7B9|nr:pentatricopeptide repeat-containing protein At2g15630, mitochondrial-like [Lotus japonicus]